ncbi:MAG: hypothetical protein M3P14_01740 [Chloroflexota bacterium]|nr:hypothetical protein [Chloroflexota bacterium]
MTRQCPTCGNEVPKRVGRGRPFTYCEQHAPARRAYMTRYFSQHLGELREYNRRRDGSRPLLSFTCADCGQPSRGYNGSQLCQLCRWHARHRRRPY